MATVYVQEALGDATGSRLQALDVMRERQGGHAYARHRGISLAQPRTFGILALSFFFLVLRQGFGVCPHDNDVEDVAGTQLLRFRFQPLLFLLGHFQLLRDLLFLLFEEIALFLQVDDLLRQMIRAALEKLVQWIQ